MGAVKTTVEIPDPLFRQAKAAAAQQGLSLKDLFTQALRERLRRKAGGPEEKPWMKAFGGLQDLHRETRRLERVVAEEFERIDDEVWR
jgi:hypothetical protein